LVDLSSFGRIAPQFRSFQLHRSHGKLQLDVRMDVRRGRRQLLLNNQNVPAGFFNLVLYLTRGFPARIIEGNRIVSVQPIGVVAFVKDTNLDATVFPETAN
jgi:hypothetical protein